jgi:hypothetical protein
VTIQAGTQLILEPGTANEEAVTVTAVNPANPPIQPSATITANFLLLHPNSAVTGNPSTTYAVMQRGNPGPWTSTPYDARNDPLVVRYFSIID